MVLNKVGIFALLFGTLLSVVSVWAEPVKTMYSTVELLAESASISAGQERLNLGIAISTEPGWHAYWSNPGDAGKEPQVNWNFPSEHWIPGELAFPPPKVIPYDTLITYGYDDAVVLLTEVDVPQDLPQADEVVISAELNWVVCDDEICVPERAQLAMTLPVGTQPSTAPPNSVFATARDKLPKPVTWPAMFHVKGDLVEFRIVPDHALEAISNPYLFIHSKDLVNYEYQSYSQFKEGIFFTMPVSRWSDRVDTTSAILTYQLADGSNQAIELNVTKDDGTFVAVNVSELVGSPADPAFSITGPQTLLAAVVAAFIGGILLNLMPCVFPILSLKAISIVETTQTNQRQVRQSGLLYTAGILVAFMIIGVVLLGIRSSGAAVGWGFQLQSSVVNVILALIMVAISLNLLEVFEFGTRLMGLGSNLPETSEKTGTFLVGLLAVVVATPCVTPFMAPAIGWAFTQPAFTAVVTLIALGFGLAFPYLLICFIPAIGRLLPRPGAWMTNFRHFMAFPMLLTAIWLFWVVGRQLGATSMAVALLSATALGFTLWVYGRGMLSSTKVAWYSLAVVGLAITVVLAVNVENYRDNRGAKNTIVERSDDSSYQLENFDEVKLDQYIATNQPTFVYFTADWCITCKVNERVALASDEVRQFFATQNIRVLEADWTTEDPTITKWLEMYDRVGVPMYLYFPTGASRTSAIVLPQILFPQIVIEEITAANQSNQTTSLRPQSTTLLHT